MDQLARPPQDVVGFLSTLELFQGLPAATTCEIAGLMDERVIPRGALLIRLDDADDGLYVVLSGQCEVSILIDGRAEVLALCGPGELVGEVAFLTGERRSATVRVLEETRVLGLSRRAYADVERRHPEAAAAMSRVLARRLRRSQLGISLHRSKLFSALEAQARRDVESDLELITLRGGEVLFRQGDPGDALYLVIGGRLRVVVQQDAGGERVLAELGRGETVGEMAILGGERRGATVYAIRDTNLARLSRASFDRLSVKYPLAIAPMFVRTIIERFQRQISRPARDPATLNTIAVVPVSAGVDLGAFCTRLSEALGLFGRTLRLSGARFDELVGTEGASQMTADDCSDSLIVERLAMVEASNRYVIYQADGADSAWTRRCARQADHVLLVGMGNGAPQCGEVERAVQTAVAATPGTHASLVLLHADGSRRPSGTRRWLEPRHVERHYHVRMDREGDYGRVARILTGHAVGLVLGGGFARGLGHPGVIRALGEAGVPVDFVGGTSMGAILAAEYAYGYGWQEMITITANVMRRCFRGELTMPMVAFLKGHQVARLILDVMDNHDVDIEDLWLPYFCVSANLTRAQMHVHTTGSVLMSILASSRAPGMYPPIVLNGDLLIDGGIVNNVPADVMRDLSNGARVIAVNVSPQVDETMTADYGFGISGWHVLLNRLNPFRKKRPAAPSLFHILMRTVAFGAPSPLGTGLGPEDLELSPPLETFKINDFHRGPEIAETAYRFALPRVKAWKAMAGAKLE